MTFTYMESECVLAEIEAMLAGRPFSPWYPMGPWQAWRAARHLMI